jgi:hypothetical protein
MKQILATLKQLWDMTFGLLFKSILVGLIRSYQILLSPRIGQVCRTTQLARTTGLRQ